MHLAWLALGGMLCSLQLSTGSFPKPLNSEEERYYLERAATGDLDARNILIERNLRLVAHIMKKYYATESDQEDLISIGTIGLIKAISSYRLDKNIRLATYASRCIENAMRSRRLLCWKASVPGRALSGHSRWGDIRSNGMCQNQPAIRKEQGSIDADNGAGFHTLKWKRVLWAYSLAPRWSSRRFVIASQVRNSFRIMK